MGINQAKSGLSSSMGKDISYSLTFLSLFGCLWGVGCGGFGGCVGVSSGEAYVEGGGVGAR